MELTFAKCESIVNTLPIGYYTGRRIGIEVSQTEQTSFYSPMDDKIVVSYPIIAMRMAQVKEGTCDEEEAVRSMLYHEVSHAILTPMDAFQQIGVDNSLAINTFEDERIESVLRNYYHDVDFRKQLYDVHGGKAPTARDADSAFFNAVRFGLGTGRVQKEINRMLKEYVPINRNSKPYSDSPRVYDYYRDICRLYNLIQDEWEANPDAFNPSNGKGSNGEGEGKMKQIDSIAQGDKEDGKNQRSQEGEGNEGEGNEEKNNSAPYENSPRKSLLSEEEIRKMVGSAMTSHPDLDTAEIAKLAEFQKTVEMIIGNFNKKNKGGSGINTYSGVFNPRAVARQDYRFFERAMSTNGNNKYGTCHLNLIIDCSGSFSNNAPLTNGILQVLSEVERKNKNFTMDVGFINEEFRLAKTVKDRRLVADGGNDVPDDMKEILMKLQKPQTCNYNIVLFDGDAICNRFGMRQENKCKLFSAFDMKQTTLITDPDNEEYMNPKFSSAKVIVTTDYTNELIDHVIHALTIAFG